MKRVVKDSRFFKKEITELPEVTGVIETIEPKDKGGAKLTVRTDSGQTRTVHIPSNYEGQEVFPDDYGEFTYDEWKPDSWGADRSAMKMVKSFKALTKASVNGAAPITATPQSSSYRESSSTPRSAVEINASEALSKATEIVVHLIDVGALKSLEEVDSAWIKLAEDGMIWHSQTSKPPASN